MKKPLAMNLAVSALGGWRVCNGAMFLVEGGGNGLGMGSGRVCSRSRSRSRSEVGGVRVGVRLDGPVPLNDDVLEKELVFEQCVTRTLSPALTLEEGLEKLKEALQILNSPSPSSPTGFLRFQVALPPSPKAFTLFCSQPHSSSVFPLIYVSKNDADSKSLYVNGTRGVCGIGAAVSFLPPTPNHRTFLNRYISSDSTNVVAYGFMDVNLDDDVSHQEGSFWFFIPQIELDELESVSILSMTLAWDEFSFSTFQEAHYSLQVSLDQVMCHVWSTIDTWKSKCTRAALKKLNLVEDRSIPRVYMNTIAPGGRESVGDIMELKESPSSSQFCVRLSATIVFSNNMSKYGGWRSLHEPGSAGQQSVWWRDLKQALNHSHQGDIIQNNMRWKNHMIRQMGHHKDSGWEWQFLWRRSLFDNEIDSAINFLREIGGIGIQQQGLDEWEWIGDQSGKYSTCSAYNLIWEATAGGQQEEWCEELWKIKIPSKFAVFAWRLLRDRLPTKKNLHSRQMQIQDIGAEEEASHLFFHCIKIQPIWWELMSWLNIKGAFPLSPTQHFLQHISIKTEGIRGKRWKYWWLAVTWSIWKLRNRMLFSNAEFDANRLFEEAIFLTWTWLRHFEKDFTTHLNQWSNNIRQGFVYLDHANELSNSLKESANINTVWASLIVEECTRLGLMYFCIAPGSRSSPLAVAAASHKLITCISCYDERSLAFHAVGYGRGSHIPAVVITSSGTAVSNLLPAVVEASQDFVPLILLTADRPPELLDCGANQAINQVNHFGSFVRFFFNLPAPTDQIPAKMVLTTLDSAVHWATSSPCGPVHINCPFREPLESSPCRWLSSCLSGLDLWMANAEPFTKYIHMQLSHTCINAPGEMTEVLNLILRANNSLLLFGAIHTEDEMWAALLLAKHLQWPVVADILSGLRLRKLLTSFPDIERNFIFVDNLDHALLSDSVKGWLEVDVVIQVEWEIKFQITAECSLTEPYVAHVMSEALSSESALFLGNSMPIRDANIYGCSWSICYQSVSSLLLNSDLPINLVRVAANRGASGIDGILSTAIGFAVGCNKKVLCVIGDISLLHDTNGLAILNQRKLRKPMTILVINNHGGAIFSTLPLADKVEPYILHQYFYTSHNISIRQLCMAHGVKHLHVKTKAELKEAMCVAQHEQMDCMVEIESSINANANFHSILKKSALQTTQHTISFLSWIFCQGSIKDKFCLYKIREIQCSKYRIALEAPPTSTFVSDGCKEFYREGFILSLVLEEGSVGYGEVAPIDIHRENLVDAEYQLRFLIHVMEHVDVSCFLSLLKGSFSYWIWHELGIMPSSIFPSVRCGLEMAILNAIADAKGSNMLNILYPSINGNNKCERSLNVQICALIDSNGSPTEVANVAAKLTEEGFSAIKLKVARGGDPMHDAALIQEVRKKVGCQIIIRADANRTWTYEEAMKFSSLVKDCNLQYIEEPVQDEDDILKFCEESGLPIALDETIDNIQENPMEKLAKFTHPAIAAVVIKPSVVGGFENAALIAQWAHQMGKMAVVSAAFESSLSLSAYTQFSSYLELLSLGTFKVLDDAASGTVAHGLGTYRWLKEDVTPSPLLICRNPQTGFVEASVANASRLVHDFQVNQKVISYIIAEEQVRRYQYKVELNNLSCSFEVRETGLKTNDNVLVFLHGFLGTGEDWINIMKTFSGSAKCISVDLPGHGKSILHGVKGAGEEPLLSLETIADLLHKLIHHIAPEKVTLVGYSMGARIALYMALKFCTKTKGAVLISGSPGLKDKLSRKIRTAKDDSRALAVIAHGLELFVSSWYAGELWKSLRSHPHFNRIIASRLQHDDMQNLAQMLSGLSIGRQPSMWEDLPNCRVPLLIMHGEKDTKFRKIAQAMMKALCSSLRSKHEKGYDIHEVVEVPSCGHAAHLENPLPLIAAIGRFLTRI
ncbi:Protein PHYLLO, chloroplastic [Glycine soja]